MHCPDSSQKSHWLFLLPRFADGETKARGWEAACPGSHSQKWGKAALDPSSAGSHPHAFSFLAFQDPKGPERMARQLAELGAACGCLSLPLFQERAIQGMGTMTVAARTSWALGTRWNCPAIDSPSTMDLLTQQSEVSPRGHWPSAKEKQHECVIPLPVDHTGRVTGDSKLRWPTSKPTGHLTLASGVRLRFICNQLGLCV